MNHSYVPLSKVHILHEMTHKNWGITLLKMDIDSGVYWCDVRQLGKRGQLFRFYSTHPSMMWQHNIHGKDRDIFVDAAMQQCFLAYRAYIDSLIAE